MLQYLLGFERLGHEVLFVEQCAQSDLEPEGEPLARSRNAVLLQPGDGRRTGSTNSSALLLAGTEETVGVPYRAPAWSWPAAPTCW